MNRYGWSFLPLIFLVVGCGGPAIAPVSGVVKLDGQPLAGVLVAFNPDDMYSTEHPQVTAMTDTDGRFELKSRGGESGAVVGQYRITVTDPPKLAGTSPQPKAETGDSATMIPKGESSFRPTFAPSRVPAVYSNWNLTPIRQLIAEGQNQAEIELRSKP